jgi:hypothetical protein
MQMDALYWMRDMRRQRRMRTLLLLVEPMADVVVSSRKEEAFSKSEGVSRWYKCLMSDVVVLLRQQLHPAQSPL